MLLNHIAEYTPPIECSGVTVINDTVASLLAGTVVKKADGYVGLIVGTGNNMAAVLDPASITKLPKELDWTAPLPVNFESGNFTPPHLTTWDNKLDAVSTNPGQQRCEKAVSGVYLAMLLNMSMPESSLDPVTGSKGVVDLAYHSETASAAEQMLARQILTRSSNLVASELAGVVMVLNDIRPRHSVCIVAEGGLFWGAPNYASHTSETLGSLLVALGLGHVRVDIVSVENANFLGSTVSALSGK
jgi:hexokinase